MILIKSVRICKAVWRLLYSPAANSVLSLLVKRGFGISNSRNSPASGSSESAISFPLAIWSRPSPREISVSSETRR